MKTAIVYNHSLEKMFGGYALQISDQLKVLNAEPRILTNYEAHCLSSDDIDFESCIFLDKDILCGLHLEKNGVRLFNNIGAIEICDDKRRTYEMLEGIIPMPKTARIAEGATAITAENRRRVPNFMIGARFLCYNLSITSDGRMVRWIRSRFARK